MARPRRGPQAPAPWKTLPKGRPATTRRPSRDEPSRPDDERVSEAPPPPREREPLPPLVDRWTFPLFATVTTLYALRARNGFVYDDFPLIADAPPIRSLRDLAEVAAEPHWNNLPYYRPLSRVLLAVEQWAFRDNTAAYHVFNAALAGLAAVLVRGLFSVPDLGVRPALALAGALLVAMHPATSEAVYPASAGPETLACVVAVLGAMVAWVRPGPRAHTAAVALLAAALLLKEQAVALPLLFVWADLCDVSYDAPGRSRARWIARYAPVALAGVAWLALRAVMLPSGAGPRVALFDAPEGPLLSLLYTAQSIVAPTWALAYEPTVDAWLSPVRALACALVVTLLAAMARRAWEPLRRPVTFWAGWFVIAALPTANVFVQETRFAERYALLALPAAVGLACALASTPWERPAPRRAAALVVAVVTLAAAVVSLHRGVYYESNRRFLEAWRASDPRPYRALASLGEESHRQRRDDDAVRYYRQALAVDPRAASFAYAPLGLSLEALGRTDEAIDAYRSALAASPRDPTARTRLAALAASSGDIAGAEQQYQQQLQENPDDAGALLNLGVAETNAGRQDEAMRHFRAALEREPSWRAERADHVRLRAKCHYNLGRILAERLQVDEAIREYRAALVEDPDYAYAHTNLALLLERTPARAEAVDHLRAALRIKPDLAIARDALARLQGDAGP